MPGRLVELEIASPSLAGNPLGDPAHRTVLAWTPAGGGAGLPAVYFLHGFTGSARGWTSPSVFTPTVPERIEALVDAGALPPFVAVFPDGATSVGGTQWIDAPAVGRYQSYVARDVVGEVEARLGTLARREARAVVGKSSGGYGALCMGRDRADVFAHVGCHAGDAYFEYCYLPDFPKTASALAGSADPAAWLAGVKQKARESKIGTPEITALNILAMAAHYSPDPSRPFGLALPFTLPTGRIDDAVWARWLEADPVRFIPAALAAFRSLSTVYVDCGTKDEFNLQWGARLVVEALRAGDVPVVHEEFADGHMGINYRYDRSLAAIVPRLAR